MRVVGCPEHWLVVREGLVNMFMMKAKLGYPPVLYPSMKGRIRLKSRLVLIMQRSQIGLALHPKPLNR